jgi:LPS sulfotransferase NodH
MYTHHKFDHEFPGEVEPSVTLAICSTPRSGSSLLCELMFNTGLAGAPTEFFDREQMERFGERWGAQGFDEYVRALLAKKTSPNGVVAFKVHWEQFAGEFEGRELDDLFPNVRYVYMRRVDHVRQAVSWARAEQTGQWASDHAVYGSAEYDPDHIRRMLTRIERAEEGWEEYFRAAGADPLRIVYEQFMESPRDCLREVLELAGVPLPEGLAIAPPTLERQADELSEEWVRRYAERG